MLYQTTSQADSPPSCLWQWQIRELKKRHKNWVHICKASLVSLCMFCTSRITFVPFDLLRITCEFIILPQNIYPFFSLIIWGWHALIYLTGEALPLLILPGAFLGTALVLQFWCSTHHSPVEQCQAAQLATLIFCCQQPQPMHTLHHCLHYINNLACT